MAIVAAQVVTAPFVTAALVTAALVTVQPMSLLGDSSRIDMHPAHSAMSILVGAL